MLNEDRKGRDGLADEEAVRDSQAADDAANEEAEGISRRVVLHAHGPHLQSGFVSVSSPDDEGVTYQTTEHGAEEPREADNTLCDAVCVSHDVRWGH